MTDTFLGKNILVTGGTGSIGSEIVRRLLQHKPKTIRVFSNDENALFNLEQELKGNPSVRFLVGDVRDRERLFRAAKGIDTIFHAAALKHVPLCEYNPFEAVKTNVLGTQNLIEVAMEEEVDKFVTISTDKAVSPVNVMGATKLLAERLTISANYYKGTKRTAFSCVRFGNVLDSRGSVVPLFRDQIKNGGPLTITNSGMTRFFMTIPKAVELVLKAASISHGGEIFIFKMPAVSVARLAEAMIEELAPAYGHKSSEIEITINGRRAGEKLYEELLTDDEVENTSETEDMYIIAPSSERPTGKSPLFKAYRSDADEMVLTKEQTRGLLKEIMSQPF